jgi:hypothetical protein
LFAAAEEECIAHRDRAAGPPSRRSPAAADGTTTQSVYRALSRLQLEILNVLRSAGGFLLLADLLFELRWRGAVQWQGTTNEAINAEFEQLVERSLVRGRMSSGPSYELTSAGWDASRRAI